MIGSKVASVGMHVPPKVWKNEDLTQFMDTSDEWIQQRTGIRERRWVDLDSTTNTSDLALQASLEAIAKAGIDKSEIEMIILATVSPDHDFPGTACFLQAKLGLPGIPALDIRQQCTGFIYGMSIADQFIKSGMYKKILVVGSEIHSKALDRSNTGREVTVLFGDGAGAVVMEAVDSRQEGKAFPGVISTQLHADGSFAKELWVPAPGLSYPHHRLSAEILANGDHFPKMNGKSVFVNAVKKMPEVLLQVLEKSKVSLPEVDLFIFHQANLRINEMVAKQLQIPEAKVFNTIERFGNTTAATIPIGLCEAEREGKLQRGMLVASAAFGSGFTWGAALFRW